MRTELVSRLVEPARPAAVNAYRKNAPAPAMENRGDTVELSAEAKRLHTKSMENELERAFMERVQTLRHQFASGTLQVDSQMIDRVADRLLSVL
jgi:anti-sigma28 factor (negative regulator of flagellin synthesis)